VFADVSPIRRHSPAALVASAAVHALLMSLIVWMPVRAALRRASGTSAYGSQQLASGTATRGPGGDVLLEILRAPDGVAIHLVEPGGGPAAGLAWWSATEGLWLAVDRLPVRWSGRTLRVFLRPADGAPVSLGPIDIGTDGSGRVISVPNARPAAMAAGPLTLEVSDIRRNWLFSSTSSTVLQGAARVAP
jgi:hypothetical protein